jgi:hypothetical protein
MERDVFVLDIFASEIGVLLVHLWSCLVVMKELIELQKVEGNIYKANLRSSWAEPLSVLFAADADYDDHSNTYTLRTPESEILALIE